MKTTVLVVLLSVMITAQTFHTVNVSDGGVNDFTTSSERFTTTSGTTLYGYVTWDQIYLYIGFSGNTPAGTFTDNNRVIHLYIDTDPKQSPKTGNGTSAGEAWRYTPSLPFNADYHYAFKTVDNTEHKRIYSGGSWQNLSVTTSNYKASGYWELRILRSDLGNPKQLNLAGYVEEDWSGGSICGGLPSGMFTNTNSGGAITFNNKYLHFNLIDQVTPNSSFNNENFSWLVGLRVSGLSLADTSYAGMAGNATDSIDSGADPVLGSIPASDYLEIYFKHTWGSSRYSRYINAFSDISGTQKIWNLEVATDKLNAGITITPDLWPNIPASYAVKLRDLTTGDVTNLRTSSYSFTTGSSPETRQFQLIIGLDGPAVQFSSSAVSFGNVHVDYSSYQTNYIKNTGIADLSVTSVTSNSSSFTVTSSASFTLAPGDSAAITVRFLPSAVQSYNGTVSVASNVTGSPSVFTVSGIGVLNSESVELPAGWSLISLPVTPQSSAPADVFGDDTDFYLLYSYSSGAYSVPSIVQSKRGYWLGLSASDTIDVTGTAITAADSVALDSAWNLVANPFLSKFSLNNIQYSKNGVTLTAAGAVSAGWVQHNYIKYSSGSYSSVTDSLSKWEGYFLNALQSGVKVIFDRNYTGNDNFPVLNAGTSENWRVQITAALNNSADRYLCFGTSPAATTGFDPVYDYLKPPPVPSPDNIETWFTVPGSNEKFAHDVKEPFASNQSGYSWQFSLFSGSGGEVTISWNNILTEMPDYIKENFSFTLQGEAITVPDMLSTTSVTFSAEPNRIYNFYINPVPTGLEDTEPSLSDFRLDQNYPNPFNPETIISFRIPDAGYTTLTIYDAAGREIKNLVEGNISAGYHRVSFVATDLSSGVYFCRLTSGNYSAVRKLLLLR